MRNLKKLLAVVVAICVLATFTVPAFAADAAVAKTDAQIAEGLDVIQGQGGGVTADYLASAPTRLQGAIMFLRLKGLETAAKAFIGTDNFADATEITNDTNKAILAYLKATPDLGFEGVGDNKFAPLKVMTAKEYYKIMLIALGFTYKTNAAEITDATAQFGWDNLLAFADAKGLKKLVNNTAFTVNDLCVGTVEALKATIKDGTKTLAADLVAQNVITATAAEAAGLYTPIPATLEVKSVSAVNLKEIVVTFNKAVDKASAETVAKYSAAAGTIKSASLADDGVTLTLSLDTNVKLSNQTESTISITNVKAATDASTVTVKDLKFVPLDNSLPKISSIVSLGNSALKVTFSEPIKTVAATMFKIDDKSFWGSYTLDGRTVTLKPYNASTVLASGSHKLTASKLEDFYGLKSLEESVSFDVVADTAAPTVANIIATLESAKIIFSEDVDPNTVSTSDIYFMSGSVKKYPKSISVSGAEVTADFSNNILPAYETTLYVSGISDYSANAMSAAEIKITAGVDQSRPEITDLKINSGNKTITITYSNYLVFF